MSDDEFESLADGSWKYEIESLRQQLSESQAELNEFRKNAKVGFDRQLRDQQKLETSQKREVMLRDWIRQQGEVTNTCTFNILKEICNECACHRAKEQR